MRIVFFLSLCILMQKAGQFIQISIFLKLHVYNFIPNKNRMPCSSAIFLPAGFCAIRKRLLPF